MYAQIVTFQETPEQVEAGIAHVLDDVIPALEAAPGLTGIWIANRESGKRLSIMVWESEAAASAAMAKVQERLAVSTHTRPKPASVERFEVYAIVGAANAAGVVKRVMTAIERGDFPAARALLHDDFEFSGPVPQPIGPEAWLGVHQALYDAMPDLRFNATNFTDDGHSVRFNVALTMHHTGTLKLPALGIADLEPTNKSIALPAESATVVVREGKLSSWSNVTPADGGVGRILAEAGAR
ncbi:MAG TPA: nuclear transport factor 2 family protein [Gemmatimonadaceae bacterium]|nr:nuclear transport factor 2 family protein [Gemmatimonadaceae bacterium]